jgi:NTP pyrophosphatase (non-canonical NTP hydrolase)
MDYAAYESWVNSRYNNNSTPTRAANLAANAELVHAILGLNGETGELTDLIKKWMCYNRPRDDMKLLAEAGDVLHYYVRVIHLLGFSLPVVMDYNREKVMARDISEPNRYMSDEKLVDDLNTILQLQLDYAKQQKEQQDA